MNIKTIIKKSLWGNMLLCTAGLALGQSPLSIQWRADDGDVLQDAFYASANGGSNQIVQYNAVTNDPSVSVSLVGRYYTGGMAGTPGSYTYAPGLVEGARHYGPYIGDDDGSSFYQFMTARGWPDYYSGMDEISINSLDSNKYPGSGGLNTTDGFDGFALFGGILPSAVGSQTGFWGVPDEWGGNLIDSGEDLAAYLSIEISAPVGATLDGLNLPLPVDTRQEPSEFSWWGTSSDNFSTASTNVNDTFNLWDGSFVQSAPGSAIIKGGGNGTSPWLIDSGFSHTFDSSPLEIRLYGYTHIGDDGADLFYQDSAVTFGSITLPTAVPEPSMGILMGAGAGLVALRRRRGRAGAAQKSGEKAGNSFKRFS